MATLPRYQTMGIQYADLPRISTAGVDAGAKSYDVLANSLDRMIEFAYQKKTTEAERKAKQYAIEFPPTKEQLQEAVKTGQFPKIRGAGDIFQRAYESTASQLLAAELQLNVAQRAASYQSRREKGETVDPEAMRRDMGDMITGYASVLGTMNPDVGIKFRAANTSVAHDVYRQAVIALEKQERERISSNVIRSVDTQRPNVRAIFANAGEISPDTGEPVSIDDKLAVIEQVYLDYSRLTNDPKVAEAYYAMVEAEKVEALATSALQPEFADNDMDRIGKVMDGDFGPLKEIWETMSPESQQKVVDKLGRRIDNVNKARIAVINRDTDLANSLERNIYLTDNRSQQMSMFNQMKTLTISPDQLKRVQSYIDDAGAGAKVDNLNVLSDLMRRVSGGDASVEDVVRARDNNQITPSTARALVVDLSNPNTDVSRAKEIIKSSSIIEREGMPKMIDNQEARSIAMIAENTAMLELITFARTPKANGMLPTSSEVAAKGKELAGTLREYGLPLMRTQLELSARTITTITMPALAGVDLMDEAAVEKVFADQTRIHKDKAKSDILSAQSQIQRYRELRRRMDQP
jgi:hypothetical protein